MERARLIRNVGLLCVGAVVAVCAAVALHWIEVAALDTDLVHVDPAGGQMEGLFADFTNAWRWALVVTVVLIVGWHLVALFQLGRSSFVPQWWCCFAVNVAAAMIALWLVVTPPESGAQQLYFLAGVNGALGFWLGTVATTPDPVRFAPPGSFRLQPLFGR